MLKIRRMLASLLIAVLLAGVGSVYAEDASVCIVEPIEESIPVYYPDCML